MLCILPLTDCSANNMTATHCNMCHPVLQTLIRIHALICSLCYLFIYLFIIYLFIIHLFIIHYLFTYLFIIYIKRYLG